MKAKIFSYLAPLAVAFSVSLTVTAQDDGVSVYVCGMDNGSAVYWKDGVEVVVHPYPTDAVWGIDYSSSANSIFVSDNGDVHLAGTMKIQDGWDNYGHPRMVDAAAYWKSNEEVKEVKLTGNNAQAIFVSENDVYIAGTYNWDGVYWKNSNVGTFEQTFINPHYESTDGGYTTYTRSTPSSIFVSGKDVYMGGSTYYHTDINNSKDSLTAGYWKNDEPVSLAVWHYAGSYSSLNPSVKSIYVSGNDVYACGTDGAAFVYWKNGVATKLSSAAGVCSIFVSGNDVYVAGSKTGPGFTVQAAYWKNGTLVPLGVAPASANSTSSGTYGIYVFNNDVYVCGVNRAGAFVYWKNGTEVRLTGGYAEVHGIFVTHSGQDVTAIKSVDNPSFHACFINNALKIESPNAELISIYSITGKLLYAGKKNEGMIEIPFTTTQGIYIIKGSVSGTIKTVK